MTRARLVVVALVAAALATSARVDAAAPTETGWWNKAQQVPGFTVPPPPGVSGDELYVALDSTGPAAVSALRLPVQSGSSAQVVLTTAPDSVQSATAANLVACPATNPWKPARNGLFAQRAVGDCTTDRAPGIPARDGKSVTFDLSEGFTTRGVLDIVITPAGSTPFSITFSPPGPTSVTVTPPVAPVSPEATPSDTPTPTADTTATAPDAGFVPTDVAPLPEAALPAPASVTEPPPAASTPAAPTAVAAPAPVAASGALLPEDGRTDRLVAFTLLVALVGGWWWVGSGAPRAPRLLGPLGARVEAAVAPRERIAGVGRFARTRSTAPRRL